MSLDATVQELFTAGLAGSTQKVYSTKSRQFNSFCEAICISNPFPVLEQTLLCCAAYLHRDGLKMGTVKSYLAAICHAQIALGMGESRMHDMPQLDYVIKGMKKSSSQVTRPRLPIMPVLL